MSRIDNVDFISLQQLDKFACEYGLWWNLEGGDNGEMNFWLELNGAGKGEYFRAKKCHKIESAVEVVLQKAKTYYKSLK